MHSTTRSTLLCLALAVSWTNAATAQGLDRPASAPGLDEPSPARLAIRDGIPHGIGPAYLARFDAAALGFSTVAPAGTRSSSLRFAFAGVQRRHGPAAAAPASPVRHVEGATVTYARPGVLETYEVRPDGVEQSFTLETLPPGTGDLVVRGRLSTALIADRRGVVAPSLRFALPGHVGVNIGRVTGIDARGATTRGWMRYDGRELELVLPAAFVEAAALPLVLDPLIGTALAMPGVAGPTPDIAYDATTDSYLVVSSKRGKVLGQRVRSDGALRCSMSRSSTRPRRS